MGKQTHLVIHFHRSSFLSTCGIIPRYIFAPALLHVCISTAFVVRHSFSETFCIPGFFTSLPAAILCGYSIIPSVSEELATPSRTRICFFVCSSMHDQTACLRRHSAACYMQLSTISWFDELTSYYCSCSHVCIHASHYDVVIIIVGICIHMFSVPTVGHVHSS